MRRTNQVLLRYCFLLSLLTITSFATNAEKISEIEQEDSEVWISLDSITASKLLSDQTELLKVQAANEHNSIRNLNELSQNISLLKLPESQITSLSKWMHDNEQRCGGFFYHESEDEAKAFIANSLLSSASNKRQFAYSIDNQFSVDALLTKISADNMASTVSDLSNFYSRYYARQSGYDSAIWLRDHWQSLASSRNDIQVSLFEHNNWLQPSVIATIAGTSKPDEIIVIGGHLDSINGFNPSANVAPGADDNASGIAVITETLRAIVAADYRPARTIQIIGYAAEEVGLRGSSEIASSYKEQNKNVIGVSQFDMTGYNGSNSTKIFFVNDYTDNAQTTFMTQLLEHYFPAIEFSFTQCGYACSDHASWNSQGFAASFPFEATFNQSNDLIHTSNDTHFDKEHATNFLKLSIAYVAELGKGQIGESEVASIQFETNALEIIEGTQATIEVERIGDTSESVTVSYHSLDGSAIGGLDYTAISGSLSWEANDSSNKAISLQVGQVNEEKHFVVELSSSSSSTNTGSYQQLVVTIKPQPESIDTLSRSSGGGPLTLWLFSTLLASGFIRRSDNR
ncbi:M20/M25/M40 family metallo-hydrolase [Aliikangiella sp. G2MR2-5]|uniref:M20/M25/M40 family metallo-hydrolase n=1 Tax=Aliikangiella sp. G2MR2-5 TaxID=2788943 RepID=UPI0018AA95D9|nr:M20/M25/M40 family metallo-hydrolase [Aliikangiella sp. G2MR2-5]